MIPWLNDNTPFPPVELALRSPDGLLAAGGELSSSRLLEAYRHGIFPWFNPGEPILWWSPDPRTVLMPGEFRVTRSLAKVLRNMPYEVRTDTAFERVMRGCAAPRGKAPDGQHDSQHGTWIGEGMIAAYCELHRLGHAHSVETWIDGDLAGGLYGVCIGQMFFGESMFSRASNASKIALTHLAGQFQRWRLGSSTTMGTAMIDCQMMTPHLASLGAREIRRGEFIAQLKELVHCEPISDWRFDTDLFR